MSRQKRIVKSKLNADNDFGHQILLSMTMMITIVAKWSSYAAPTASGLSWLTLPNLPLAPLAEDEDDDENENIMMRMMMRMKI